MKRSANDRSTPSDPLGAELDAHHALSAYTLERGDESFIHQHVVDAWAAQHAVEGANPIGLTFALAGLYLHLERGFTGRRVQRAHMEMGRRKREWPGFAIPEARRAITASEVMAAPAGPERDQAIEEWCRSVWEAFADNRPAVEALLHAYGII